MTRVHSDLFDTNGEDKIHIDEVADGTGKALSEVINEQMQKVTIGLELGSISAKATVSEVITVTKPEGYDFLAYIPNGLFVSQNNRDPYLNTVLSILNGTETSCRFSIFNNRTNAIASSYIEIIALYVKTEK